MRLVTWNVNSLKARLPRVLELLDTVAPDVVCLQETKCASEAFPVDELRAAGYEAAHHSAGRWAGVAILARDGLALTEVASGLEGEARPEQARWIEARVGDVHVASVYVVNGQAVGTEPFAEKLAFLDAMAARAGGPARRAAADGHRRRLQRLPHRTSTSTTPRRSSGPPTSPTRNGSGCG